MPPRILALLLAMAALVHWGLGWNPPVFQAKLAGSLCLGLGLAVNVWASRLFQRHHTPICPDARPTSLVVSGPFRFSRNPMYVGLHLLLLGVALLLGSLPFYLLVPVYALILRLIFIPHEERALCEAFGDEYTRYARRVRRWFGIRSRH